MLPDFKLLLIDSLPRIREALVPLADQRGPLAGVEAWQDMAGTLVACSRLPLTSRPAVAVVPLAVWNGQDPGAICTALLNAAPDLPVVLVAPELPEAWRQWVARHPTAPRLMAMELPLDLNALRFLGAAVARGRRTVDEAMAASAPVGIPAVAPPSLPESAALESLTNDLRHSEERFAAGFRASPFPQAMLHFGSRKIVEANAAFLALTGFSEEELREHSVAALEATGLTEVLRGPHPLAQAPATCRSRSGELRHLTISTQPATRHGGTHLMLLAEDITERVQLQDQLRQAQRMEAMGQLAAGVAHDFNNILTIIQGHLSLQLDTGEFTPPVRAALRETLAASQHAATLTRQLLTLSRNHLFEPAPLDLNSIIQRMMTLLQRLIGEHIAVEWQCQSGLPWITGDVPGIEQVVMNLVLQARDAMPRGGRLRIATGLSEVSASSAAQNPEAREGTFVRFSIVDTGCGMDQGTVDRLRTAFAAAGPAAADTGANLSAVHHIVRQHEGWVELFSEPGQGTAIFVYLPAASAPVDPPPPELPGKTGLRVLLVEDEPAVRAVLRQLLIHGGCTVLEAGDAPSALTIWETEKDRIHLLITDIVMPGGMTGHDLALRLTDDRPELKVIYSSGYSASLFQVGQSLVPGQNFLPKPYDANRVLALIRRVAGERPEMLSS